VKSAGDTAPEERAISVSPDGELTVKLADVALKAVLSDKIDPEHKDTAWTVRANEVELVLRKETKGFWAYLLTGGKAKNKLPNLETDWDRWVDEDDCIDEEEMESPPPVAASPYEPSESAKSAASPLLKDNSEAEVLFQGLHTEEKMVLFASMWNASSEEERKTALQKLIGMLDSASADHLKSADIKGGGVLGERDMGAYPTVNITHLAQWMAEFAMLSEEDKVESFARCWNWCDDQERRLTMAGLA